MRSEGNQEDWGERERTIKAYRAAAEAALHNPYFTDWERKDRSEFYRKQADRLEGKG